jgi:dTDP-4-dehydrorhamnose reductase
MPHRVLLLGSSGMAGHVIACYLRETGKLDVVDVGPRRTPFPETRICDLGDSSQVLALIEKEKPTTIVNCIGVLVAASEAKKREAVWFNAYLPHLLSEICLKHGIRLVHLSTDCVFSGACGPYKESDYRDGDAFYDRSKALGELQVLRDLTIRTSIIGPEIRPDGTGLFEWLMRQDGSINGFQKAMWSGVTTLELAKFILHCIKSNNSLAGLVHYSVPGGISKHDLIVSLSKAFGKDLRIVPTEEPVLDKRLICTRKDLGISPPSYSEQISSLQTWMNEHAKLYERGRIGS